VAIKYQILMIEDKEIKIEFIWQNGLSNKSLIITSNCMAVFDSLYGLQTTN
jgi:hypothetical protein